MNSAIAIMAGIALAAGAAQAREQEQAQPQEQENPTEAFDRSVTTEEDREDRTGTQTDSARHREHGSQPDLREPFETQRQENPTPIEDRYDRQADAPETAADEREPAEPASEQQAPTGAGPASTATLPGKTVITAQGEEVGTIEQVGYSRQHDARVATVNVGGFLGAGDKVIAIPISELGLGGEDDFVTTSMDRTSLETAREFDPSELLTAEEARSPQPEE